PGFLDWRPACTTIAQNPSPVKATAGAAGKTGGGLAILNARTANGALADRTGRPARTRVWTRRNVLCGECPSLPMAALARILIGEHVWSTYVWRPVFLC